MDFNKCLVCNKSDVPEGCGVLVGPEEDIIQRKEFLNICYDCYKSQSHSKTQKIKRLIKEKLAS